MTDAENKITELKHKLDDMNIKNQDKDNFIQELKHQNEDLQIMIESLNLKVGDVKDDYINSIENINRDHHLFVNNLKSLHKDEVEELTLTLRKIEQENNTLKKEQKDMRSKSETLEKNLYEISKRRVIRKRVQGNSRRPAKSVPANFKGKL